MSLLLTFNKCTALGVLPFSIHHFYVSKHNSQSEHKFALERLRRNKQKMSAGKKTIEEKQTIYLKVCNILDKTLHCIRKYFIMWDIQFDSMTRRSRNDPESGCL